MKYLSSFVRFWVDFIIGDDRTAAVVLALVATALLSSLKLAWAVLPLFVLVFLGISLRRAALMT